MRCPRPASVLLVLVGAAGLSLALLGPSDRATAIAATESSPRGGAGSPSRSSDTRVATEDLVRSAACSACDDRPEFRSQFRLELEHPTQAGSESPPRLVPPGENAEADVNALIAAQAFEPAASLAAAAPDEARTSLLTLAYHAWAGNAPEVALDAALMLDDPVRRRTAFHAAVSGWARADPRALAECVAAFPQGPERTFGLGVALRVWRRADQTAALAWVNAHGIAAVLPSVVWED